MRKENIALSSKTNTMPFCNVKEDLEKIRTFAKENGYKDTMNLNDDLKACLYMEAASFIGFWNVIMGYYLAKSMKDAMCKLCKPDIDKPQKLGGGGDVADNKEFDELVKSERWVAREKISKQEKADLCFWVQYMNCLSTCPNTSAPKGNDHKNTYASLMPGIPCWPRPC